MRRWLAAALCLAATSGFAARSGGPNGPGLPAWPTYRDAATGKAQVLGDTVATEPKSVPGAPKLRFFDSAYQQLLKGGAQ